MYSCLKKNEYRAGNITFAAISKEDMEPIRLWRNEQMDILRQSEPLSYEAQENYFTKTVLPSFTKPDPQQILWSIKKEGHLIGYGALVHIDWEKKTAEVSFLLNTAIQETSSSFQALYHLFLEYISEVSKSLNLKTLTAEVYQFRTHMIQLLEKEGFHLKARLEKHIFKKDRAEDALFYEKPL